MEFHESDIIFLTLIGTFLLAMLVGFVFAAVYLYKRRQMEYINERMRREQEFSEEMLRTQLELTEKIMNSISEEIHDNVGQLLTVAKMSLNAMTDADYKIHADTARDLITRSLRDLRNLSKTLNGDYILREGIQNAIEREIGFITQAGELDCTVEGKIDSHTLSPNHEIVLYRCIQEALTNILKHSRATRVLVKIDCPGNEITVDIIDDGIGFDPDSTGHGGVGMASMKKRITMMGGKFQIYSTRGSGTKVKLVVPATKVDV